MPKKLINNQKGRKGYIQKATRNLIYLSLCALATVEGEILNSRHLSVTAVPPEWYPLMRSIQ